MRYHIPCLHSSCLLLNTSILRSIDNEISPKRVIKSQLCFMLKYNFILIININIKNNLLIINININNNQNKI